MPQNAVVRVTDLDSKEPRFVANAANDGSFTIEVPANSGDELRMEWVSEGERSPPLDVIVTDSSDSATLTLSPRFECLGLNPGYVLRFSAAETQTLFVGSECEERITLGNARTRLAAPYFSVTTGLPTELSPTSSVGVSIIFNPTTGNEQEDVLFLDVSNGAETLRYPITLAVPPFP